MTTAPAAAPPPPPPGGPVPDEDRYQALFRATYADLVRFVERRLHPLAAEDVVAEVFVVAWRRLEEVPADHGRARAWLFGVAQRTMLNARRGDARRQALAVRVGTALPADVVPDGSDRVVSQVDLARAWCLLSPSDQEALTLTALDGLSTVEAAQVLGISRTALSLRLVRARRRLRVHLDHPATPKTAPADGGPR
nr:sigma-70 family RNA polymerase sigma factor [Quadrisphaera sp. RL12-1S]